MISSVVSRTSLPGLSPPCAPVIHQEHKGVRNVYGIDGSFVVTDVWDTAGDHTAFYDANVKANLPEGHSVEVHELASHVAV